MRKRLTFVALDFETADPYRDSACAVALMKVTGGKIVDRSVHLIRPPRKEFHFTYIHGLTWEDVRSAERFGELWPKLEPFCEGAAFLAAHSAPFDKSVLRACCQAANLSPPDIPFLCTCQLARRFWDIYPTRLPDVCRVLRIPLDHHQAESDAEACARIVLAAEREFGSRAVAALARS